MAHVLSMYQTGKAHGKEWKEFPRVDNSFDNKY
jgi:hypothetical protein